ncbi:hypothetical protein GQ464_007735 [Rhodocaloribacter litoris]|uniref:hypothetical protein n=1 Tax=Rhodocaloribacter litoris TaxID=2558931 RepID=UPI0014228DD0|nr:hypothetical protein [Rhodocaloribacter litoris]QXD16818.1 hypothetical protein GQ464_007735 [Rhodocaloribacter litoris]GIV60545.1 MAG: hypothetical protein KatS3mg043_1634 [Rhodothermaceae bacterium]
MSKRLRIAVYVLWGLLGLLALGWIYGVATGWDEIVSRPVRLAYIICDAGLVIPLGVVAGLGLRRGRTWAPALFALALGALLFDVAHGVFYLIWDNYFGIPLWLGFVLLAVLAGYVVFALKALWTEPAP